MLKVQLYSPLPEYSPGWITMCPAPSEGEAILRAVALGKKWDMVARVVDFVTGPFVPDMTVVWMQGQQPALEASL